MQDGDDYDAFFRPRKPPGQDEGPGPAGPPRPGPVLDGFPPPPQGGLRGRAPRGPQPPAPPPAPRWRVPALIGLALAVVVGGGAYLVSQRSPAPHQPAGTSDASTRPSTGASRAPLPAMLTAGQVGPRSAVPWKLVGPGWVLAEYTKTRLAEGVPVAAKPTILYLVDPLGGRYKMHRWAGRAGAYTLLDWSGDRARALFASSGSRVVVHQLDLATGTMTRFRLPAGVSPIGYTRPDGTNLLAVGHNRRGRSVIQRFNLTGALQATLATGASAVDTPDGTTVAIGTSTGIEVVSNAGGRPHRYRVPGKIGCSPVRWWNAGTVLAACSPPGSSTSQLWLVPTDGARPTALTPVRTAGADIGDVDAWKLSSGLYLQADGAGCGLFIARQATDGSAVWVNGQGSGAVNSVLAVVGTRMLVRAGSGCPSSGSLIWLTPATGANRALLTAPFSEWGVTEAVAYGGRNG